MKERCAEECLFHWSAVVKAAGSGWDQQFAAEIAKKAEKPWWRPTAKQLVIMRRMTDALFYGDSASLIEVERPAPANAHTGKGGHRAA
ncbi:MAG: hypothetical protein A2092_15460 [Rhodobacteraceae bacterium GWE1_64_9]|nr:MAG: hypothetical protein A2092_15460 [Rhodobacteraceae bacterium GWE1_64_9]OHC47277.1 MAG: hypothetical protein A2X69_19815 [Rhodobacteraceae bacterium GWF1_65_7]HBD91550.1 hypothetical protein [Gemmobacter sp.]